MAIIKTPSYPKQYVSCRTGSMQVFLHDHTYEFVCNRLGNHYYRCVEATTVHACRARILVRGPLVYHIDAKHTHSVDEQVQEFVFGGDVGQPPPTMTTDDGAGAAQQRAGETLTVVNVTGPSSAVGEIVKIVERSATTPKLLNKGAADKPPSVTNAAKLKERMASKLQKLQLFSRPSSD